MKHTNFPYVTLNGSSINDLVETADHAVVAAEELVKALAMDCPHPRDSFPEGYEKAREQHNENMKKVKEVLAFLNDKFEHMLNERDKQKRK